MEWNDVVRIFKKRSSVMIEYLILLIVTIASALILYDRTESKRLLKEDIVHVTVSGEYSTDGGMTYMPFDDYDEIDMRRLNHLIIRGHFDQDIRLGDNLYMFLDYTDVSIYAGGRIVYVNDPEVAYCWDVLSDVAFGPHDEVMIELTTKRNVLYNRGFRLFLNRLSDSTKNAITARYLQKDIIRIFGEILLMLLGALIIQNYVEVRRSGSSNRAGILSCAAGIIAGSVGSFINADYITLILPQFDILEYIDTLTQIYTVVFILSYLRRYIEDETCKKHSGVILVVSFNITLVYMLWRAFSTGSAYTAMIPVMIAGVIAVFCFISLLIKDFMSHKDNVSKGVTVNSSILLGCVLIEIVFFMVTGTYLVDLLEIGMIIFAVGQYALLVNENIENRRAAMRAKELENELMQSRINVMVSQIQPHFMYNALSTIRALISKKPEEARTAIDFFTKYIRANMDSLSQTECIPFKKEMDHVRSYLYIEKLRFGDMLDIEYDIEADDFTIPAMTVQTLSENAVKHGLLAREEGGTLKIKSRETANCYEVQIIDDGIGFDTSAGLDDSRSHVGIENSRKRLAAMCGGTLSIGSKVGQGTTITITIPRKDR